MKMLMVPFRFCGIQEFVFPHSFIFANPGCVNALLRIAYEYIQYTDTSTRASIATSISSQPEIPSTGGGTAPTFDLILCMRQR